MKISTLLTLVFSILVVCAIQTKAIAQCTECSPDLTCGGATNFPAVCPQQAADGTTGEYYEQVLTFYIPNQVIDPQSGFTATLVSVQITAVSGLPFGLTYTLNDEDGVYYPAQGQNYGCATICGTPLLPGTYSVLITVSAVVNVLGQQFTQTESFPTTITVLQGTSSTGSFTYDQPAGCGSLEVNFDALISAPQPAITTYEWNFGNGQTSSVQNPAVVVYDTHGDYAVSLTTTVSEYKLQQVVLQQVAPSWNTGFDEDLLDQNPDPYFVLINGNGVSEYSSSVASNTTSYTWSGLNLALSNPPYTLHFFDDDLLSDDDDLGTASLVINAGTISFSTGTGTSGTQTISLDTTTQVTDEVEIVVFPFPDANFTVSGNVLTCNETDLFSYAWHRNGMLIQNATGASYTMTDGGQYYLEVQNEFGCLATSSSYLHCLPVSVSFDLAAMEVEVANAYSSYQWYFNNEPIPGATTYFVSAVESGNYSVQVTTSYGCTTMSNIYNHIVGISENSLPQLAVFPNPADDVVYIQTNSVQGNHQLNIYDISGRNVKQQQAIGQSGLIEVDVSSLPSGIYSIQIDELKGRIVKR